MLKSYGVVGGWILVFAPLRGRERKELDNRQFQESFGKFKSGEQMVKCPKSFN